MGTGTKKGLKPACVGAARGREICRETVAKKTRKTQAQVENTTEARLACDVTAISAISAADTPASVHQEHHRIAHRADQHTTDMRANESMAHLGAALELLRRT